MEKKLPNSSMIYSIPKETFGNTITDLHIDRWAMIDIKTGQILFNDTKVIYDMVEVPE